MKLWKELSDLRSDLTRYSKRFVATCETLYEQNGWYVSRVYQERMYRLAMDSMSEHKIELEGDLICLAIEQASFVHGEKVYWEILGEIEQDKMLMTARNN